MQAFWLWCTSAGTFDEGWLYTNEEVDNLVGNDVSIKRDDGLQRFYHVKSIVDQGFSQSVFRRFKIVSVEE